MLKAPVLLAAVLVVCVASSAEARRRHHGYWGGENSYGERSSTRSSLDAWRRARDAQGQDQDQTRDQGQARGEDRGQSSTQDQPRGQDLRQEDRSRYDRRRARNLDQWRRGQESGQASGDVPRSRDDWRRARDDDRRAREERRTRGREDVSRAAAPGAAALRPGRSGPFGAAIEKLARGCAAQAAEFENWPFDSITQTVGPDEAQRNALTSLRNASNQAAQQLATGCPQDIPAAPAARLEAVEQGIDATLKAFDVIEPALQAFYTALNDEQKARLYRDMASATDRNPPQTAQTTTGRREAQDYREARDYSSRRQRWRDYAAAREAAARAASARESSARNAAPRQQSGPGWSGTCEELAAVLRNWPVREIERDVQLAGPQRVAFYELVTASLKAADTLASACPAQAALTPVGRLQAMRKRLSAVRAATAAIRAPLARFYEALDQGQKVRFAGMS